jgi:hypothetical protein
MSDQLPVGALFKVVVEVCLPVAATEAEALEWLRYKMGDSGCSNENPLLDHDFEPWGNNGFDAEYTGYVGRKEVSDRVETPTGCTYRVRFIRERAS